MSIQEYTSKRTGKTAYKVRVRKMGRMSHRTFTNREKAEEWETLEGKRLLREVLNSSPAAHNGGQFTVSQAVEEYRKEKLNSLMSNSWKSYLKLIEFFMGDLRVRGLNHISIKEARDRYMRHRKGEPLKPASGNKFTTALAMVLNFMVDKGWLPESPMKGWENIPETQFQRERILNEDEKARLFAAAEQSKSRFLKTVILVALYTGYRKEVIQTLTWKSVDFEKGMFAIPQKFSVEGKQGKPRATKLPIVPELRDILLKHKSRLEMARVKSPFVFPSPRDATLGWDFSHPFRTAVKNAKLKDFHFHDLRHTAATYLVQAGVSTHVIQTFLGHKDPRVTERYMQRPDAYMKAELSKGLVNIIDAATPIDTDDIFNKDN